MNKLSKIQKPPKGLAIKTEVRFGKPTVTNTRVAISDILGLVEAGYQINEIPAQYPTVTVQNAKKALNYAANILGKEEVLTISG